MYIKKKYLVDEYWEIPDEDIQFVGGKEGVFCSWRVGNTVYFAEGDDGFWIEIASYHKFWIPNIISTLTKILSDEH